MIKAIRLVAGSAAVVLLAAGCSTARADKSGADVLLLHLASIDGNTSGDAYQAGPEAFVRALEDVSDGHVRVDLEPRYGQDRADAESSLVTAIRDGDLDGGWPASRAFAAAGIPGLAALEAPMTVTGYRAERDLAQGDAAGMVMAALDGSGIQGLGLMVGPLRRPFGVDDYPLSLSAWDGMRFRSFNSPVQSAAITALGGTPVLAGGGWPELARSGELDGVEFDVAQYYANGLGQQAGKVVANVVLWPKMLVLAVNAERWHGFTDQQRRWIQQAADQAVAASVDADDPEEDAAALLCARGTRFRSADPGEVLGLRRAVQPVIDALAEDPEESALLEEVESVGERYAADTITVPPSCTSDANLPGADDVPTDLAPLPDGTYRKEISEQDVAQAGLSNNDGTSGTWTLEIRDGRWSLRCRPLDAPGLDCGHSVEGGVLDAGSFYGDSHVVWMVSEPERLAEETGCRLPAGLEPGRCSPPPGPTRLEWRLQGDNLVFTSATISLGFETILEPYVRIE